MTQLCRIFLQLLLLWTKLQISFSQQKCWIITYHDLQRPMPRLVTIGENRIQKKRRHFVEIKKKDFF